MITKYVLYEILGVKNLQEISTFKKLCRFLYTPKDPSSLALVRLLFGFCMLCDIPEERGGAILKKRWGDSHLCHFPLISTLQPLPFTYIGIIYGIMWLGALGITLGYKYRHSTVCFTATYWYIFLIDKSYWNNHSYLFGLLGFIFSVTDAHYFCSLDCYFDNRIRNKKIPRWQYFLIKYQIFILYFIAGLKKSQPEWLSGQSMTSLGNHWIFEPLKLILTTDQIDYLIVHWFAFVFDLTICFWLMISKTRVIAVIFCSLFHLMNSRLFSIGMFPYVCLSTMPLFFAENWPNKLCQYFRNESKTLKTTKCKRNKKFFNESIHDFQYDFKKTLTVLLLILYCFIQLFLPYSHFLTKGYNNWTNGQYGYSWDMMIHSWDVTKVTVKVHDNEHDIDMYINPKLWTKSKRWFKYGDMTLQFAKCFQTNFEQSSLSTNISIYVDVLISLNKRIQQRMFDPNYDLLKANWSPFQSVEWLLPLTNEIGLDEIRIRQIQNEVFSWSNASDCLILLDFPGLFMENIFTENVSNVSITVLQGDIIYEEILGDKKTQELLKENESKSIKINRLHRIHVKGQKPAIYIYTYLNILANHSITVKKPVPAINFKHKSPFPLVENSQIRIQNIVSTFNMISECIYNFLCDLSRLYFQLIKILINLIC